MMVSPTNRNSLQAPVLLDSTGEDSSVARRVEEVRTIPAKFQLPKRMLPQSVHQIFQRIRFCRSIEYSFAQNVHGVRGSRYLIGAGRWGALPVSLSTRTLRKTRQQVQMRSTKQSARQQNIAAPYLDFFVCRLAFEMTPGRRWREEVVSVLRDSPAQKK